MIVLIIWCLCAAVGYSIGEKKGRRAAGFWLGLLLGIFGIIIIACMSETYAHATERYRSEELARRLALTRWAPPDPRTRR